MSTAYAVPPACRVRLELAALPNAAAHARAHARDVARRWGVPPSVADDLLMVVSELVTNACLHAAQAVRRTLVLVLSWEPSQLTIHVWDSDPTPPTPNAPLLGDEGGRGLAIVQALCSSTNWSRERVGKTVWGTLRLPQATVYGT